MGTIELFDSSSLFELCDSHSITIQIVKTFEDSHDVFDTFKIIRIVFYSNCLID